MTSSYLFLSTFRLSNAFTRKQLVFFLSIALSTVTLQAQKDKDIIPVVTCVKDLSNGLIQVSFGYENPTNKEVVIDESGSIIKSNKGKRVANGLNKFKPGSANKVFTKEFGPGDYVEWTIISNGNTHTVIANANSSKCPVDDGFIEPVLFNGKSTDIIGQELSSLCDSPVELVPSPLIFQIKEDKILVEVVPVQGQLLNLIAALKATPFTIQDEDFLLYDATNTAENLETQLSRFAVIDVYIKKEELCFLNDIPQYVNFARPVYPATTNSGGVITQGDAAQTSGIVRDLFRTVDDSGAIVPVDGSGITIGVLSDSYDTAFGGPYAPNDIGNGELPDDVNLLKVLKDNASDATDEGRAMMQIIHDVAPGAALQFHTATASPREFEEGFNALAIESDIIVDDITFITEPFFIGNGRIASAVESFVNQPGKFHFTSAGNLANKGFQSKFAASATIPVTNFIPSGSPTRAHLFDGIGGTDYLQEISVVPGTYLIALQWKELLASQDNSNGALEDLDIYIVDDLGRLLVGSNRVNIAGDPTEIIVFRATGSGTANILITSANGETRVPFRYIAFYTAAENGTPDGLKFEQYFGDGAPTVSGHAMIPKSVTTGAVGYRYANPPIAESFSSYGGLLEDGTTLEIDLYAPDGGNTSSTTIGQLEIKDENCPTCDGDSFKNFYGTSAAAPHFAGAMALFMSAAPSWFPADPAVPGSTTYTAEDALQLFQTSATPFTAADGSAAGFLNTFAAFTSVAAPSAKITELRVEDGKTPSAEPFTVTIIGEFFPDNPEDLEILFDDQSLENVEIITQEDGSTIITATVPTFSGNPELFVVTNGTTPGGTDGGPSNPLTFFDDGKLALNIIANNATFEYGQDIGPTYYNADPSSPDYIAPYSVEGLPLDADGVPVPYEVLGLPDVVLNNSAIDDKLAEGGFPIVFDYVMTPSFGDETYDQELFQINFISGFVDPDEGKKGYLTITKKNLTITPYPIDEPGNTVPEEIPPFIYTYGDAIDLTLNYAYDDSGIFDNFYSVIDASHQSDFKEGLPNKFRAVVSKFRAVVSGNDIVSLLDGGSWSASDRHISNKFRAVVSGMNVIDLDTDDFTNYIAARDEPEDPVENPLNKFRAVVSKFRAVVSAEDLFAGDVDLTIESKFRAVVSKFRAVVSTDDPDRPYSGYQSVFSIIDAGDAPPEEGEDGYPDPERAISDMYSLNMITGLEVTPEGGSHYVYPGAFLNDMSANFNITYVPGSLIVNPRTLEASTDNLEIPYGTVLTQDNFTTTFNNWAFEGEFQESEETVFADPACVQEELAEGEICPIVIPYYFIKLNEDGTAPPDTEENRLEINELTALGDYLIKIRDPQNYVITHTVDATYGTLTIEAATLAFNPPVDDPALTIKYGETPTMNPDWITGFATAYSEDESVLYDDSQVPYYFKKVGGDDTEYTIGGPINMDAGDYEIFITDDPSDNYIIVPDPERGILVVEPATLTVTTNDLANIAYGIVVADVIGTNIPESEFAYDESISTVFPDGIPYLFVKGTDDPLTIDAVKELGTYVITVEAPSSGNYVMAYNPDPLTLTIVEAPITFTSLAITETYGISPEPKIVPVFSGIATAYFEDESVLYDVDGLLPYYFEDTSGTRFEKGANLNAGDYEIFITDKPDDNYVFPETKLGTLRIDPAILTFAPSAIPVTYGETPVIDPGFGPFAYDEGISTVFPEASGGIPYYFVDTSGTRFEKDANLNAGVYEIHITDDLNNYTINSSTGTLLVNKAILSATIQDLVIDEGTTIYPSMISTYITGYAYTDGEQNVFGDLQYSIVDVEDIPYTGAVGTYFIKILEPPAPLVFNYMIEYNRIGTVYVNPIDQLRKIRTYADCVEENPGDPDNLYYIAHFRYENPNDEAIYILEGPENQLTGPAALTSIGELPIKFLPGEHTFEIRFDGTTLKWELTSMDSNHKTSTTTNVNANSNKCDTSNIINESGIPNYILYPNPVTEAEGGILYIEQDIPAMVTLDVYDFFGTRMFGPVILDGTNAPDIPPHEFNMSGSGYPVGMYFIRLTANSNEQVFSVIKAE
jgi:hypothetical protein